MANKSNNPPEAHAQKAITLKGSMIASSISWFSSDAALGFWEAVEAASIILVIVGVWGEYWAENRKFKDEPRDEVNAIVPVEILKRNWEERVKKWRHKWESFFWRILLCGLAVEFISFGFSITISGRQIESLKSENLVLEKQIQPRRITPEQRKLIADELRNKIPYPVKRRVTITAEGYDSESRIYAQQIIAALNGGFIYANVDIGSISTERQIDFGIKYIIPPNPSYEVRTIAQALKDGGVTPTEIATNSFGDEALFQIWIGAKPMQ
jgi:hypothetical protein